MNVPNVKSQKQTTGKIILYSVYTAVFHHH